MRSLADNSDTTSTRPQRDQKRYFFSVWGAKQTTSTPTFHPIVKFEIFKVQGKGGHRGDMTNSGVLCKGHPAGQKG